VTAGGLLGVFAHPDDETYTIGGCMARYTDEGIPASILCFTRGEAGVIGEGSGATRETLGEVREAELRAACAAVGVTDVRIVGTADSGTAATPEGVAAVAEAIRELRPRVVATMEPHGVTRHPDHIAVSRMATEAFHLVRAESGGEYPSRLYYGAIPESWMKTMLEEAERRGLPRIAEPDDPLAPQPAPDDSIACRVDVSRWVDRKAAALRAHRTQSFEMIQWLPEDLVPMVFGFEAFQRPFPEWKPGDAPEDDLFGGFRAEGGGLS
jgi:N-acetyl-1-D-myo-inositol-2-amino-2-deoxy-alpha-D-glucopyranoside deacetylase